MGKFSDLAPSPRSQVGKFSDLPPNVDLDLGRPLASVLTFNKKFDFFEILSPTPGIEPGTPG